MHVVETGDTAGGGQMAEAAAATVHGAAADLAGATATDLRVLIEGGIDLQVHTGEGIDPHFRTGEDIDLEVRQEAIAKEGATHQCTDHITEGVIPDPDPAHSRRTGDRDHVRDPETIPEEAETGVHHQILILGQCHQHPEKLSKPYGI